jgi:hypothetical protein
MFTKSFLHCKLTIFSDSHPPSSLRILKRYPKVPDEASLVLFLDPYHSWTKNSWIIPKVHVIDFFYERRRYVALVLKNM